LTRIGSELHRDLKTAQLRGFCVKMHSMKIVAIFLMINVAVLVLAGAFFVMPAAGDLRGGQASVHRLERRYAAERRFLADYEENLREIAEIRAESLVLRSYEKIPALAEISRMGAAYGLEGVEFSAAETSVGYMGAVRIFETRVRAEYTGSFADMVAFLQGFSESYGMVRSFSVTNAATRDGDSHLRLEFSLFGMGE